jgi:hypothetical protein
VPKIIRIRQRNKQASQDTFREKQKRFLSYPSVMSHFINAETPCLREAMREPVWQDAITEENQYILNNDA